MVIVKTAARLTVTGLRHIHKTAQSHLRWFLMVTASFGLTASTGIAIAAETVGEWAPVVGLAPEVRTRQIHVRRSRCLPRAAEVAVPVYPLAGIIALDWGRVKPDCRDRSGWSDLGAIRLVSGDDAPTVAAWYAERLSGYAQYRAAPGLLFIARNIENFLWSRDYYKYSNVAIKPADSAWQQAGYKTIIELNRPAPD